MEAGEGMMGNQQPNSLKDSLCRFYLRGLCDKAAKECEFAHGIEDLIFCPWQPGEHVEYDYQSNAVFCQKSSCTPLKNYLSLFEFQKQPLYSLEEININRAIRLQIRSLFHRALFKNFTAMLQNHFEGVLWTEEFLLREYTRTGFNKLMTRIHFSHLQSFLLEGERPLYFKISVLMPPNIKKQTIFYIKRASDEQIIESYKESYRIILKDYKELTVEKLKRKLISSPLSSISVPPLLLYLKQQNKPFKALLQILGQDQATKIQISEISQPTLENLLTEAKEYLTMHGKSRLISWSQLLHHLCQSFGLTKLKQSQILKVSLSLEGYFYFHLPFTNLLYHASFDYQFHTDKTSQCPCNLKQVFELEFSATHLSTIDGEVFEIVSASQLYTLAPLFLNSGLVAVDLEGDLRRGGTVEMVQISTGNNIFLIDLLGMIINDDRQSIQYTKKVLRNLMAGPTVKIFHDCRQDSIALHELLETCILNVFDTSALEMVSMQYQRLMSALDYEGGDNAFQMREAIQLCKAINTPSLNNILIKYSASHGPNILKDLFHSQWSKGSTALSKQRPLNPQFRSYCISDVIDLVEIYQKMRKGGSRTEYQIGGWLSKFYAKAGYIKYIQSQEKQRMSE